MHGLGQIVQFRDVRRQKVNDTHLIPTVATVGIGHPQTAVERLRHVLGADYGRTGPAAT